MQGKNTARAGILALLLLATGGIVVPAVAEDDAASELRPESDSRPETAAPLTPGPQKPRSAWNENDPYLRSLVDPFESNAARDQRFGRENALTSPRVDPDF
jgi:hypothetical protein